MTRHRATLGAAVVLLIALVVIGSQLRVPYVILLPGPVTDTLGTVPADESVNGAAGKPVISISGAATHQSGGHLYLTTVLEQPGDCNAQPTLWQAVKAWFSSTQTVDPKQVICAPGESNAAVQRAGVQQMQQSQQDAVTAALFELGKHPSSEHVSVGSVEAQTAAGNVLRPGDVIVSIDGTAVHTLAQIRAALQSHQPGDSVRVGFRRGDSLQSASIRLARGTGSRAIIGFVPDRVATFPQVHVSIGIDPNAVGGPSAGTALALGIIDKLTPGGLTGGRTIAGTGTVDGFGHVGPIGGIQQKVAGAVKAGATVFFAPASECGDAKAAAPSSLTLVRVQTLHQAVQALRAIKAGSNAFPHC
ncbi:MAG TPA: PDZ domain-containing protein [Mycobacteriales bacterium]|nr:PDZ domain-containing protein [Mycobacteriales bacterium]